MAELRNIADKRVGFEQIYRDYSKPMFLYALTKTYLFRSVKNNCLNRLKKKDVLRDRLDLLYGDVVEEEMMAWNDELIQEVETEITNMPEQTREIIRSVFFQDLKYQEVADQLGISINTVKTLLKNGMKHLREHFAGRGDLFLMVLFLR